MATPAPGHPRRSSTLDLTIKSLHSQSGIYGVGYQASPSIFTLPYHISKSAALQRADRYSLQAAGVDADNIGKTAEKEMQKSTRRRLLSWGDKR